MRAATLAPAAWFLVDMLRRLLLITALAALFSQLVHADAPAAQPPSSVLRAMQRHGVPSSSVSIFVRDVAARQTLVELHPEQPRSPASTIKVLTTFAALDMLGPGYTWKTRAFANGELRKGVLEGDLVLVGGGDPYMTTERWWTFVRNLRARGVEHITGDVVLDNTFFAPDETDRGAFDGQIFRSYNVLPDALMVNFQTTRFTILAAPLEERPQIVLFPQPENLKVQNRLRLGPGECRGYNRGVSFHMPDPQDPDTVAVSGVFPASCGSYSISRAVGSAPSYAYGTFRSLWSEAGGRIDGRMRLNAADGKLRMLYEHESLLLPEIIRLVNKHSNNVMARHLLLTLGAERYGAPGTIENGRTAVRAWLAERNIPMPGFVLDNGSGLSRTERVTARGMGELLDAAWRSPFMPEFAASLPLSAVDGTLRERFDGPGMQGRIRLKTGRIDDVSGLAGYIHASSGATYVVVILINHPGAHLGVGEAIQSELVKWVFAK